MSNERYGLPENACLMAWKGLELDTIGHYAPCCKYIDKFKDDKGTLLKYPTHSLKDAWTSPCREKLKQDFLENKRPASCQRCWDEEDAGIKSYREITNEFNYRFVNSIQEIKEDKPIIIDFKLSNLCNLKCRICSPYQSSLWIKEYTEDVDSYVRDYEMKTEVIFNDENKEMFNKWLPTIKQLQLFGGEPLVHPDFEMILKLAIQSGHAKDDMHVTVNSNGTIFSPFVKDVGLRDFHYFNMNLSIDDIGQRFEYQRHPAKWHRVENNIRKFAENQGAEQPHGSVNIYSTLSIFNIYYLPEFLEWTKQFNLPLFLNLVHFPHYFSLVNLPKEAKEATIKKLEAFDASAFNLEMPISSIVDFIKMPSVEGAWEMAVKEIKRADKYRSESFQDVFPEFYEILNSSGNF